MIPDQNTVQTQNICLQLTSGIDWMDSTKLSKATSHMASFTGRESTGQQQNLNRSRTLEQNLTGQTQRIGEGKLLQNGLRLVDVHTQEEVSALQPGVPPEEQSAGFQRN